MSGELWQMARNGTTLLPGEARKLALAYDRLREERDTLRERLAELELGRSIEKFTAAEHIAALVAMGAERGLASQMYYDADVLYLPPEMAP
jgi:hypothetical protein